MKKILFFLLISISGFSQVKISDMPAATTLTGTELVPIVQSGVNKKATPLLWQTYLTPIFQATLVSGTNIKTVNGNSLLGSGNIAISEFSDPMTTRGDIIVRNASNVTARLGRGTANQLLISDGTDIAWTSLTASNGITKTANNFTLGGSYTTAQLFGGTNNANGFQVDVANTASDYVTLAMGSTAFINPSNAGALEMISVPSTGVYDFYPAITLQGNSARFGTGENASTNTWRFYLESLASPTAPDLPKMRFVDNRAVPIGMEYAASYSAAILGNARSIPDIETVKDGAYTLTNKTISGASNTLSSIPVTALNAGTNTHVLTTVGGVPTWAAPSGGGGTYYAPTTLVSNATDANFTATLNGVHNILDGVASTNRVITIPTGSNGDVMKFYNTEDTRVWSFTGATVYLADRVTVVTELLYNVPCHMERIDGRWIITN